MANSFLYTTMAGDTFDSISLDFYDDEHYTSKIIQANLQYRTVITFAGGEILVIPILEEEIAVTLPPWKQAE